MTNKNEAFSRKLYPANNRQRFEKKGDDGLDYRFFGRVCLVVCDFACAGCRRR